jgi:hypothetical protein
MRHESDAARPPARPHKSKTAADDRAKTVGADNHTTLELTMHTFVSLQDDTAHMAAVITCDVRHPRPFFDARTGVSRPADQDFIEHCSSQREPTVSEGRESLYTSELGVDRLRVWGAEMHARQLGSAGGFDFVEHTHVREDSRRLRTEILRANLVTREMRAIDHQHVDTGTGERPGRRSTGRAATNDDDVGVARIATRQPTARETR